MARRLAAVQQYLLKDHMVANFQLPKMGEQYLPPQLEDMDF